jgi:hypothetical protein
MYCNQLRHRWPGHFQAHSAPSEQLRMREGSAVGGGGARPRTGTRGETREATARERGRAGCGAREGSTCVCQRGRAGRERPGTPAKNGSGKVQAVQGSGTPAKESTTTSTSHTHICRRVCTPQKGKSTDFPWSPTAALPGRRVG